MITAPLKIQAALENSIARADRIVYNVDTRGKLHVYAYYGKDRCGYHTASWEKFADESMLVAHVTKTIVKIRQRMLDRKAAR